MIFGTDIMADPVVASDGFTYERKSIEDWMENRDVSPSTNEPFEHKFLNPNVMARKQIALWCEQNGVPVPRPSKLAAKPAAKGGGAAAAPMLLRKPDVTCAKHPQEQVWAFCRDCCRAICCICAVDSDFCKSHTTKALKVLIGELKTDREGWAQAQQECDKTVEQLCTVIQADGDAKKRAIDSEVAELQQQVRSAAAARSAALGTITQKREEREELVAAAATSPGVAVQGSPASAVIACALDRAKAPISPASAAHFCAVAVPAVAVGQVSVTDAVKDLEAAVRIAGQADILAAAAVGDIALVKDHLMADGACVNRRSRR
jgi:hypothetical protein